LVTQSIIGADNPLGIYSIDYLEFCTHNINESKLSQLFYSLGMGVKAHSQNGQQLLFSQGQIRFLLTQGQASSSNQNDVVANHAYKYYQDHGEGVSTMAFLVENAEYALAEAKRRGAQEVMPLETIETAQGIFRRARIQGFGDVHNEFVERPRALFHPDFVENEIDPLERPIQVRMARIDHLTNNVPKGEMKKWVEFYQKIFGFVVSRYFDIKGLKTGLLSEVVQLKNGNVIIPINEPEVDNGKSQIQEYLDLHKGAGVQHIAMTTPKIIETVADLQSRGIKFLSIPHTYYQDIKKRGINVEEDLSQLEERQLLVDGDDKGYLLQNFTQSCVGPLFFEIIQRKNHNGFGEGNFKALFDSIERDQMQRGYL